MNRSDDEPVATKRAGAQPVQDPQAALGGCSVQDAALVQRLLGGDERAFTELVDRHHGALLRLARVFVSSQGVAEEVVQETWTAVIHGLARFEGRSSLKTWIFRILTNRAKTRGVREGRTVPLSSLDRSDGEDDGDQFIDRFTSDGGWAHPPRRWESDTPERLSMQKQAMDRLSSALQDLPANQRAVVTLRDLEGLEGPEICAVLDISEANQRVLLHRGRSKLRRVLEDYLDGV